MKKVEVDEAFRQLGPSDYQGFLAAWANPAVDFIVIYSRAESASAKFRTVGSSGDYATLAKALRSSREGIASGFVETLSMKQRLLAAHEVELSKREEALLQKAQQDEAFSMRLPPKSANPALASHSDKLVEKEKELNRRENELIQRTSYISEVENSLILRLEDAAIREAELNQREEELDERESKLMRKENFSPVRLVK